jgi:class 3 adenylate cyclase/tetratricopeptide (TPR) repeat protein
MKICQHCQKPNPSEANFCSYCGKSLGEAISNEPAVAGGTGAKRAAERRQLTILFCDLVDSTPLSQQLDPEEYRQVITNYHRVAEGVVGKHGGHIAQYLGDGLLVYFGYPEGLEDAPRVGVQSGLGILGAMAAENERSQAAGKTVVKIRIGIHTGLVVVDDHQALGETVNIAARLEGVAPHNGLVISPQTLALVEGWFDVESTGEHQLKGISRPMEVFQVHQASDATTRLDVAKRKGLSPLVGRSAELGVLFGAWETCKAGNGKLILLTGEPGIGKSRLVDALEDHVSGPPEPGYAVARCSSYQSNSSFFPLIEMFGRYVFRYSNTDAATVRNEKLEQVLSQSSLDLAEAMSLFAEFLSVPTEAFPPLIISPVAKRQRLMNAFTQVLLDTADHRPVLLVIEDLHWSDPSTLEWLKSFISRLPTHRILTVCTMRPGLGQELPGEGALKIDLRRLSNEEMVDICHHQTRGKLLPPEILKQIATKTEGVPLFVEELTKMIMESEWLVEKSGGFEMVGSPASTVIPSTLQDSLLARLDRLSGAKEIVQIGAVLGREFSFDMLRAVVPTPEEQLGRALSQLLDAEIFYRHGESNQVVYQFKHALIQDAAYESLLKSSRQQLHNQVASVLEEKFTDIVQQQPELLAHHYTEAGEITQAIPLWLRAGQQASQKNAAREAIAHLEKGIALVPNIENKAERDNLELDFQLTLGGSFVVTHGFPHPKVKETFNRARDIAQTIEVSPKLALVLINLGSYYVNTEDYQSADELLVYLRKLADDPTHGYWFDLFNNQIDGFIRVIQGDFEGANGRFNRVVEIFDPTLPFPWELAPSGYMEAAMKGWLMVTLQISGHLQRAEQLAKDQFDFAATHKDSMTLYHIHTFPALYKLFAREWRAAEMIIEEYLPIVRAFGDPVFILTAEVYSAISKAFQGEPQAFDTAVHLVNVCLDVGFRAFAISMAGFMAELYYRKGDHEGAIAWIERIQAHVAKTGSHINAAELERIKGLALQAQGNGEQRAEQCFREAMTIADKQGAKLFALRAAADLARHWRGNGRIAEAQHLLDKALTVFPTSGHAVDIDDGRALLADLSA